MKRLLLILLFPAIALSQTVGFDTVRVKRVTGTVTAPGVTVLRPLLDLSGSVADSTSQNYAARLSLYTVATTNTYNAPYYSALRTTGYGYGNFHHTASLSGIRAEAQVDSGSYDTAEGIDAYAINNSNNVSTFTSLYAGRFQVYNNADTIGHGIGWKVNNAGGTGTYQQLWGAYIANQTKGIENGGLHFEGVGNGGRITWSGNNSDDMNSGIKSEYAGILRLDAISVGINSSPDSNITLNLSQPTGLGAQNGAAISLGLNDSLYASANNDVLYGLYINTKPSANGKSGVSSYALYSPKADSGYFVGPWYQFGRSIQGLATGTGLITQQDSILYFGVSPGASVPKKMEIRMTNGSAGITGTLTSTRSTTLFNTSAFTGLGLGNTTNQNLIFATYDTVRIRVSSNDGMGVTFGRVAGTGTEPIYAGSAYVTGLKAAVDTTSAASYTMTASNYTILVDATTGNKTVVLPAVSAHRGRFYVIKKTDSSANTVTIDPNGTEQIDGSATVVLYTQYSRVRIQGGYGDWQRVD